MRRAAVLAAVLALTPAGAAAAPAPRSVPILMYHVIATPPAGAPYPALYVPRAEFEAQVQWLDRIRVDGGDGAAGLVAKLR